MIKKVNVNDIEEILGFKLCEYSVKQIDDLNLEYQYTDKSERDEIILDIIKKISNNDMERAGDHRLNRWESGWHENLISYKSEGKYKNLIPRYFGKYDVARWKGDFVKVNKAFDYNLHIVIVDAIFHKFITNEYTHIYEFGCGPAYNLYRMWSYNKLINMVGLDWANISQEIINVIKEKNKNIKISGENFNFMHPNYKLDIEESSVVFTHSALEQIGESHKDFIDFVLCKKPALCINFEPAPELLNRDCLMEELTFLYQKKRNYLRNYFSYLFELEKNNKIKIIYHKKINCGSRYMQHQSIIVWKPIA